MIYTDGRYPSWTQFTLHWAPVSLKQGPRFIMLSLLSSSWSCEFSPCPHLPPEMKRARGANYISPFEVMSMCLHVRFEFLVITASNYISIQIRTRFCAPVGMFVWRSIGTFDSVSSDLRLMKVLGYFFDTFIMVTGLEWFRTTLLYFLNIPCFVDR